MLKRREFIRNGAIAGGGALAGGVPFASAMIGGAPNKPATLDPFILGSSSSVTKQSIDWSHGHKPLFCVAYIDPGIDSQKGQEAEVAKYPIALVPQDNRLRFRRWRDRVRRLNPDIKLLAYQMVIEETGVPGPGHDVMRALKNSWVRYKGGIVPTVTFRTNVSNKRKRIFDPRHEPWQQALVQACQITLLSDDYDGLFLDQCTVYDKAALDPRVKREMLAALGTTLDTLRNSLPNTLIIGNSHYSWPALNGEMNENRPKQAAKEFLIDERRRLPRVELFHKYYRNGDAVGELERYFKIALENKAFFGCALNAQTTRWLPMFDRVLANYEIVSGG